ncbi:MAG: YeiH family protein [Candidatus Hydrogenedentes bacterium]|nr:YeiH family protein [Candidatus Hydrogenedentota bacterium]
MKKQSSWSDLIKLEDWWAIWLGFILLASVFTGAIGKVPKMPKWAWGDFAGLASGVDAFPLIGLAVGLCVLFVIGIAIMGKDRVGAFLPGFVVIFLLSCLTYVFANEATVKHYGISYAFWAVGIGLLISNTVGVPEWLKPAMKTEFYIKTGLVIMGAGILFGNIMKFGAYGLAIAWGVTPIVIIFMWVFGTRVLKMVNKPLVIIIATATSVCGVSAAIAAAAACKAKKEDLTIAVGMTLIFTVAMMIFMPILIVKMGLPPLLGGAWMGGTIDATGAVGAAGAVLGEEAEAAAIIVKMIQNILIGVVAFCIAVYWVTRVELDADAERPGMIEVWNRFPKFILGFVVASLVASFVLIPLLGEDSVKGMLKQTKTIRGWLFTMAFLSIGLESNFKVMAAQMKGGKPMVLYLVGQTFNIVLTLFIAWLVLSGVLFPDPPSLIN